MSCSRVRQPRGVRFDQWPSSSVVGIVQWARRLFECDQTSWTVTRIRQRWIECVVLKHTARRKRLLTNQYVKVSDLDSDWPKCARGEQVQFPAICSHGIFPLRQPTAPGRGQSPSSLPSQRPLVTTAISLVYFLVFKNCLKTSPCCHGNRRDQFGATLDLWLIQQKKVAKVESN